MSQVQEQIDFHDHADEKRHFARINNQILNTKEKILAKRILSEAGEKVASLLDIGCGEGTNLFFLKHERPNIELTGLDFSPAKVNFMANNVNDVQSVCADALKLPFPDNSYDCVLCRDILHHVYWDREGVLSEAKRVVKPDGKIIVIESDGRKLLNRIFRLLVPAEKGMKDSVPSRVQEMCAQYGLVNMIAIEPSFLLRAFSFVLGAPRGLMKPLQNIFYNAISIYEKILGKFLPERFWFYWMFVIRS